jgi:hypothetical protein
MRQTAAEFVQSFEDAGTPLKLARRESSLARVQRMSSWRDAEQNITQDERRNRKHCIERACRDWISIVSRVTGREVFQTKFALRIAIGLNVERRMILPDDLAFIRSRFARYAGESHGDC